jgi:hypothetical protein
MSVYTAGTLSMLLDVSHYTLGWANFGTSHRINLVNVRAGTAPFACFVVVAARWLRAGVIAVAITTGAGGSV